MQKNLIWKTITEKIIYSTPWLTVKEEVVQLPNSSFINDYSVVELPNVAMVFPLTHDNKVIMVKQYRHGVKKILLELPAGTYNSEREKPEEAAKRELWEETGFKADMLVYLGTIYDYPTKDRHSISIYFTDSITFEATNFKEDTENVEIVTIPFDELDTLIQRGEIAVGGTISAIYLAKVYLKS